MIPANRKHSYIHIDCLFYILIRNPVLLVIYDFMEKIVPHRAKFDTDMRIRL